MGDRNELMMAMEMMGRSDLAGEEDVQLAEADAEEPFGEGRRAERSRCRWRFDGGRRNHIGCGYGAGNERWGWSRGGGDVDEPICVVYIVF